MVHVAVNKYDFVKKNQHFRVRFWGGGHQKAYAVYAFINVDNCERPLTCMGMEIDDSQETDYGEAQYENISHVLLPLPSYIGMNI